MQFDVESERSFKEGNVNIEKEFSLNIYTLNINVVIRVGV